MKWTVVYRPSAQDQLANIWLRTTDRNAVALAADEIDRILSNDPLSAGESRGEQGRIIVEPPLTALFDVYVDDARVEVFSVFRWKRREDKN